MPSEWLKAGRGRSSYEAQCKQNKNKNRNKIRAQKLESLSFFSERLIIDDVFLASLRDLCVSEEVQACIRYSQRLRDPTGRLLQLTGYLLGSVLFGGYVRLRARGLGRGLNDGR